MASIKDEVEQDKNPTHNFHPIHMEGDSVG